MITRAKRTPPPARIDWSGPTPRSVDDGDLYFQPDGLAESRHVFIDGAAIAALFDADGPIAVGEVGFGLGLNFCAVVRAHETRAPNRPTATLHYVAAERRPPTADDIRRMGARFPEITPIAESLAAVWPTPLSGWTRIRLGGRVALTLLVGDAADELSGLPPNSIDAWLLDGFAPQSNGDAWSDALLDVVAQAARAGATLATFSAAGAVRRGLADRGFTVEKRPGFGRKRHCVAARKAGSWRSRRPIGSVDVSGRGVAGVCAYAALAARGVRVSISADDAGPAASALPLAMVSPRLDVGDGFAADFYPVAFRYAAAFWGAYPGWRPHGALRLATTPEKTRKFVALSEIEALPRDALALLSPDAASDRLGVKTPFGALDLPAAGVVTPNVVLPALIDAAAPTDGTADIQVLANGVGARDAIMGAHAWMSASAGQMSAVAGADVQVRYAGGIVFGHWLGPEDGDRRWIGASAAPALSADQAVHERNFAAADAALQGWRRAGAQAIDVFTGIRVRTRDRNPVMGRVSDGRWMLAGLGARGFSTAPLLGEALADLLCGTPPPLPAAILDRLSPQRFV